MPLLKKIVVIGPESTGKSTLCEQLADHFKTEWVPEFARNYLLEIRRPYTYEDLLFIDTDMYVMKVWCEYVFKKCYGFILDQIATRKYDGYLLCNTDLPWVADELREYPDLESREKLFHMYKDLMINQSTPWIEITGDYDQRLQQAINFTNVVNVEG